MAASTRKLSLLAASFAAALFSGAVHAADNARIAEFAENMANNVAAADNVYNANTVVDYPGYKWAALPIAKYKNSSTCAPFVSRTVMAAFDWTTTDLRNKTGSTSPSSAVWHDKIVAGDSTVFTRARVVTDIQRGDIVAIKYLPCSGKTETGHTMIAVGTPVLRSAPTAPLIANTVQYELKIADSTSSPHAATDANNVEYKEVRTSNTGSGAGIGTIRLYADAASGVLVGYTWSMSKGSDYYDTASCRVIAVGRFK